MAQGQVDRFGLRPHAVAVHDCLDVAVLDLDVCPHFSHTPRVPLRCSRRVLTLMWGSHSLGTDDRLRPLTFKESPIEVTPPTTPLPTPRLQPTQLHALTPTRPSPDCSHVLHGAGAMAR